MITLMITMPTLANTISTHGFDDDDLPACAATPLPEDAKFAISGSDCGYAEGLAAIIKDDHYGYVNTVGELIIPAVYQAAYPFSDGLALYLENDHYGYLDTSGQSVIAPQYTKAWEFSEGRAKLSKMVNMDLLIRLVKLSYTQTMK